MTYAEILLRTVPDGECFRWTGSIDSGGYGYVYEPPLRRTNPTHRVAYIAVYGSIPAGMTIDHVKARGCRYRDCVRIEHLEAVSPRENVLRGDTFVAKNATKTHCIHGHLLEGYNLLPAELARGRRGCRTCHNDRKRAAKRSRKAA